MHKMKILILEIINTKLYILFVKKCCMKADIDGVGEVINLEPFEIICESGCSFTILQMLALVKSSQSNRGL